MNANQHSGANAWTAHDHSDEDATPSIHEVDEMAVVLEGRHGRFAAEIADFLATKHAIEGDAGRCWAWAGVAEQVRQRTRQRLAR